VPALRALRTALPDAEIVLIGLPWARELVRRLPAYLDDFLEFPGYPGLPEREPAIERIPGFFAEAQRRRFDLALQMHGSGAIVNPIVALLGARSSAGYVAPGQYRPDPDRFLPYPEGEHEVRIHLRLMEFLGIPPRGEDLEFPLQRRDREELEALGAGLAPGGYACIHAGARYPSRRWPAARFAAVADALAARGLHIVLTGSEAERPLSAAVRAATTAPVIDLTGRTSLGAFAALIAGARLVVCNDTGTSHVAAAQRTPSVVIASGSDVARWAPLDRDSHRVLWHDVPCRPCAFMECPIDHPCATGVGVEAVLREAEDLLARPPRVAAGTLPTAPGGRR
jgi:ADP-heptose:LPS heptosyltransferase